MKVNLTPFALGAFKEGNLTFVDPFTGNEVSILRELSPSIPSIIDPGDCFIWEIVLNMVGVLLLII